MKESIFSEVSLFQGLNCRTVLGERNGVFLISECILCVHVSVDHVMSCDLHMTVGSRRPSQCDRHEAKVRGRREIYLRLHGYEGLQTTGSEVWSFPKMPLQVGGACCLALVQF